MARCSATNDALQRCRRQEGHLGEHSAGPRGTTLRNVRVDDERWDAFKEACAKGGTDASAQIRDMIDEWMRPMHWYRVLGGMIHDVSDVSEALRSTADIDKVTCRPCLVALAEASA